MGDEEREFKRVMDRDLPGEIAGHVEAQFTAVFNEMLSKKREILEELASGIWDRYQMSPDSAEEASRLETIPEDPVEDEEDGEDGESPPLQWQSTAPGPTPAPAQDQYQYQYPNFQLNEHDLASFDFEGDLMAPPDFEEMWAAGFHNTDSNLGNGYGAG